MYEIVKKSIGMRILIGIIILFAITQTLKFFLKEPTVNINDELVKTANEINKHAPIVIDSLTTFDNVNALKGNVLQYNYTIKADKLNIDTIEVMKIAKEGLLELLKKILRQFISNKTILKFKQIIQTKNGVHICTAIVLPTGY